MATVNTSTIKPSGGDYSTLQGWESDRESVNSDLVTNDIVEKGVVSDFTSTLDGVTIDGFTTDKDHFLWLTVAEADRHNGTAGSGIKIEEFANFGGVVSIEDLWCIFEYFEVENTGMSNPFGVMTPSAKGPGALIYGNLIYNCGSSGIKFGSGTSSAPCYAINNLIYDCSSGISVSNEYAYMRAYNNTCANNSTGFANPSSNEHRRHYKNNVAFNNTTNYENSTVDGADDEYNASDDASASDIIGSNSVTGISSSDFNDTANDDYTIPSGSALEDAGTSLSTEFDNQDRTDYTVADEDAIGTARPQGSAWDIGFFEVVATAEEPEETQRRRHYWHR